MKNIYFIILSIILLAGASTSCQDDDANDGQGKLNLSLFVNDQVKVVSRTLTSDDTTTLEESCKIYVYSDKGLVRKYHGVSELPKELWLVSGDYKAQAWAGDSVAASFTQKYYKGITAFTITKGQSTEAKIDCKIANVVTSVKFDFTVDPVLSDYTFTIGNAGGNLAFSKANPNAKGYFMMGDEEKNLTWTLTGKKLDGSTYTQTGTIPNVQPTTEYTVNVSYNNNFDVNVGGALFNIKIDETSLDIPNEFQLTAAPKMIGSGFDITKPYYGEPALMSKLSIYATAATSLTKFELSGLNAYGFTGSNQVDYFSMTDAAKADLSTFGMTMTYTYDTAKDQSVLKLTLSANLLNSLPIGSYPLTISATDAKGKTRIQVFNLQVSNDAVKTISLDPVTVYATTATLVGYVAKDGVSGEGFEYRKVGDTSWTSVDGIVGGRASRTATGSYFTAAITGLTPGTEYEYRAKCSNNGSGVAFTSTTTLKFTTEYALQLQNAGFEEWSTASDKSLIPSTSESSYFWDCGNHGSITLDINVTTQDTSIKHGGTSSAKLSSKYPSVLGIGKFAAGNIFIGRYIKTDGTDGVLGFGRAFASRPKSLTGYVKYTPGTINKIGSNDNVSGAVSGSTLDKGLVYIALLDESTESYTDAGTTYTYPKIIKTKSSERNLFDKNASSVIAYGEMILSSATTDDSGEQMTKFTINLDYRNNKKPTAILIVCSASYYGDYFTGSTSSVMWIDDFHLNY